MKSNKHAKQKIIVVLGPTASGKSDLAVALAKKFNGEVISADSRQVYKSLNIGSGKITKKEMQGIKHHMLDVADPKALKGRRFTVDMYKKMTEKVLAEIISRGKLPIICGGTGFYIQSVVDDITLPDVLPNLALRKKLKTKSTTELLSILRKLDPKRAETVEQKNPIRLIRAIEIATALGKVPELVKSADKNRAFLQIGIKTDAEKLKKRIANRLLVRFKNGMLREAARLHKNGLSYKRMEEFGLEYRFQALYLQGKITKAEMQEKLNTEINRYARRQMTWFKKDKRIKWFELKDKKKIEEQIKKFLKKTIQ